MKVCMFGGDKRRQTQIISSSKMALIFVLLYKQKTVIYRDEIICQKIKYVEIAIHWETVKN